MMPADKGARRVVDQDGVDVFGERCKAVGDRMRALGPPWRQDIAVQPFKGGPGQILFARAHDDGDLTRAAGQKALQRPAGDGLGGDGTPLFGRLPSGAGSGACGDDHGGKLHGASCAKRAGLVQRRRIHTAPDSSPYGRF